MANGHGGRRTPANPAPVSNPQSGQRTDGGPGSSRQPLRVPAGGGYGATQAAEQMQRSAPLAADGGAGVVAGSGASQGPPPMGGPLPQLNAPSQRPNESIMAGAVMPQGETMPDPDMVLRVLYDKTQNPWIARLIRQRR